ncbi:MAG: hypothetical protein ACRDF7_10475, partial [Candidatus Limnocylindrales bacterium]
MRIVLVALLTGLIGVSVVACTGPSPSPSSSPSPAASATAAAGSPGPTGATLDAQIGAVEADVPPLRELAALGSVPNRILDAAGLHTELERLLDTSMTPQQFAAASRFGARMGLLPAGTDLRAVQLSLLGDQVLGFYDRDTKSMTLVQRGTAFGPLEKVTLAHEFTHALQDQHFHLDGLGLDDITDGDRAIARLALIEGDATLLMTQWATHHLTIAEALTVSLQGLDPAQQANLTDLPPILRRQLLFPYVDGLAFVTGIQAGGGWSAVDAVYARPPASTEQVMHPDKYATDDEPVDVPVPAELGALGSGWTQTLTDTLGELTVEVWLQPIAGEATAKAAAAGWGGDRVAMFEGPGGAWLIAWSTAWDTP